METYPSVILPAPSVSFNADAKGNVARTEMDTGRIRQRARSTRKNRQYKTTWQFSELQFGIFQSWVKYKLTEGADAFLITLPVGAGDSLQEVTAKIIGADYSGAYDNVMYWNVSCVLEVEGINVFSESELDAFIEGAEYVNPPRAQNFTVDLVEGETEKDIEFPSTFGTLGPPPGLKAQLVIPTDGYTFEVSIVEVSITETGFTVNFSAAIPGAGYSLSIIASHNPLT